MNFRVNKKLIGTIVGLIICSHMSNAELVLPDTQAVFDIDDVTLYLIGSELFWQNAPRHSVNTRANSYVDENGTLILDDVVYDLKEGEEYMESVPGVNLKFNEDYSVFHVFYDDWAHMITRDQISLIICQLDDNGEIIKEWKAQPYPEKTNVDYVIRANDTGLYKLIIPAGVCGDEEYIGWVNGILGMSGHANPEIGFYFRVGLSPTSGITDECIEHKNSVYKSNQIYDIYGKKISKSSSINDLNTLPKGIYLVNGKKVVNH